MTKQLRAVVLLSGGLDSAVTAALAKSRGFEVYALTVAYGQRHAIELDAAQRVAQALGACQHVVTSVDLRAFGGSALTDKIEVPKSRSAGEIGTGIPVTYVPARNTIFLALALAFAETIESQDVFIGVSAVDFSGYPDCRPAFIEAFEKVAAVATKAGVEGSRFRVHAPLLSLSKAQTIREGLRLGVDFSLTHSCYDPSAGGMACGQCDSCTLRRQGFREAGIPDPCPYIL